MTDPVLLRYSPCRSLVCFYLTCLIFREFRKFVICAAHYIRLVAALFDHVLGIIFHRSYPQMGRVDTRRIIAGVTNYFAFWNLTLRCFVRCSVGADIRGSNTKKSISKFIFSTIPYPAITDERNGISNTRLQDISLVEIWLTGAIDAAKAGGRFFPVLWMKLAAASVAKNLHKLVSGSAHMQPRFMSPFISGNNKNLNNAGCWK